MKDTQEEDMSSARSVNASDLLPKGLTVPWRAS